MSRPDVGHAFFPALRLIILCLRAKNTDSSSMAGTATPNATGKTILCHTRTRLQAQAWLHVPFTCAWKSKWKRGRASETLINVVCVPITSFVFHVFVINQLVSECQDISHWTKRAQRDLFCCQEMIKLIKRCQKVKNRTTKSQSAVHHPQKGRMNTSLSWINLISPPFFCKEALRGLSAHAKLNFPERKAWSETSECQKSEDCEGNRIV